MSGKYLFCIGYKTFLGIYVGENFCVSCFVFLSPYPLQPNCISAKSNIYFIDLFNSLHSGLVGVFFFSSKHNVAVTPVSSSSGTAGEAVKSAAGRCHPACPPAAGRHAKNASCKNYRGTNYPT